MGDPNWNLGDDSEPLDLFDRLEIVAVSVVAVVGLYAFVRLIFG